MIPRGCRSLLGTGMWTPATRRQHSRDHLRYETDLTDAEWALIEPLLPAPKPCGRPRGWPLREVLNAIFYVLRGGVAWRLLPTDLPPRTTVYRWFALWRDTGLFETLNHHLVMADRERVGRDASPSAAVLMGEGFYGWPTALGRAVSRPARTSRPGFIPPARQLPIGKIRMAGSETC